MYAIRSDYGLFSSTTDGESFRRWHSHRNDSFDSQSKANSMDGDDEIIRDKFRFNTLVQLETGQRKNIQQLTSNDLLICAKQSPQYSGLLARVDYIGSVDKITGKAELRLHIHGIEKSISYHVLQAMPFFVRQYSCWSSVSPEHTRRLCGLHCRPLECGDLIIAITNQQKRPRTLEIKPDYTQQSPTKCLVERYINEKISSATDNLLSNNKRLKISKE